jgi:hypothetical protein
MVHVKGVLAALRSFRFRGSVVGLLFLILGAPGTLSDLRAWRDWLRSVNLDPTFIQWFLICLGFVVVIVANIPMLRFWERSRPKKDVREFDAQPTDTRVREHKHVEPDGTVRQDATVTPATIEIGAKLPTTYKKEVEGLTDSVEVSLIPGPGSQHPQHWVQFVTEGNPAREVRTKCRPQALRMVEPIVQIIRAGELPAVCELEHKGALTFTRFTERSFVVEEHNTDGVGVRIEVYCEDDE